MTLAERITAILAGTGWRPYSEAPPEPTHSSGPFFHVDQGAGATACVGVAWTGAAEGELNSLLHRMGIRLHEVGLTAEASAGCLYVSEHPCKCVISGGDLLPIACPAHGTPCGSCGGLESCAPDCGGEGDCGCGPYCALCRAEEGDLGD